MLAYLLTYNLLTYLRPCLPEVSRAYYSYSHSYSYSYHYSYSYSYPYSYSYYYVPARGVSRLLQYPDLAIGGVPHLVRGRGRVRVGDRVRVGVRVRVRVGVRVRYCQTSSNSVTVQRR